MSETINEQKPNDGFWAIWREAIAGSERDFTEGKLGTAIFLLSVPMILEMVMESVFALVDIFFVGKLGANAVAVVGLTESLMTMIYAAAIGLSIGATATVARRTGEGDADGAARSAIHVLYLGLIVSAVLGVVGGILAPDLLKIMGAEPEVVAEGANYTRVMLGGNAVVMLLFLINGIFRGAGDAAIAMRVLWLANILNIILAPCFIFGAGIFARIGIDAPQFLLDYWIFPELGVTGAAVGTTIGRGAGVVYALWQLFKTNGRFTIRAEHFQLIPELLWKLVKLSAGATIQMVIGMASWIGLVRIVSNFGSEAVAGYTIGIRIIIFALLPSVGMSNAAATLVGQCLGANKPERAEAAVWRAGLYSALFLTVIGALMIAFASPIVGAFTTEAIVVNYAIDCLRIVALGFFFYGFGMVVETSFNGAGDTLTPTYLNLFVFWLFEIPLAYVLAYNFGLGIYGVFWAITIAFTVLAIISALLFKRGKWKQKVV